MRYQFTTAMLFSKCLALGVLAGCFSPGVRAQNADDAQSMRLQILNGKTGRPLANQHFHLLRKDGHVFAGARTVETTDGEGYAAIPNVEVPVDDVVITIDGFRPCSKTEKHEFVLAQVRASGVVSENSCRQRIRLYPQVGTLIFFVREETFFEKMRR